MKDPSVLNSTASESPENTKSGSQKVPLSSFNVQQTGTGRPVMGECSSSYSEWNIDDKWSSQLRKSVEMSGTSTLRPVSNKLVVDIDMDSDTATESDLSLKSSSQGQPPGLFTKHTDKFIVDDNDVDSDTDAEADMSLKSRSFLHKVNDRVREILDQSSKDAMQDSNKHSLIWLIFLSSTLEASGIHGKNYSENLHSIKNTVNNLTMRRMFDISEK